MQCIVKRKVQVRFGDSMFCFVLNAVLLLCPPGCGCCGAAKVSELSSSAIWCRRLGLESNALSSANTTPATLRTEQIVTQDGSVAPCLSVVAHNKELNNHQS